MSGAFLTRHLKIVTGVVVATTAGSSTEIDLTQHSGGVVYVPSGGPSEVWTVHARDPSDGSTYLPLQDKDGTAVTFTVAASEAYELNPAVFACGHIKITGATTGDTVALSLKG